jgi:hypothetical protein
MVLTSLNMIMVVILLFLTLRVQSDDLFIIDFNYFPDFFSIFAPFLCLFANLKPRSIFFQIILLIISLINLIYLMQLVINNRQFIFL